MNRKVLIGLLFVCLTITVSMMSHTYSRYVAGTDGTVATSFASWQILVNENDVLASSGSKIEFTPIVVNGEDIASNKLAPTSSGYFDIEIDPSNIGLSFRYTLTIDSIATEFPDLYVSQYEIINEGSESNPANVNDIIDDTITNTLLSDGTITYRHQPFTIRVYFNWYDGVDENSDDQNDTDVSNDPNAKADFEASILFEQII